PTVSPNGEASVPSTQPEQVLGNDSTFQQTLENTLLEPAPSPDAIAPQDTPDSQAVPQASGPREPFTAVASAPSPTSPSSTPPSGMSPGLLEKVSREELAEADVQIEAIGTATPEPQATEIPSTSSSPTAEPALSGTAPADASLKAGKASQSATGAVYHP